MVSKSNITNGNEVPSHGYQNCNSSQILIFNGYVKVVEFY